jgi:beta-galactosidase
MKFFAVLLALVCAAGAAAAERVRTVQSFDGDWLFARGDAPAAEQPMFDDTNWRTLDVPHDWGLDGAPAKDAPSGTGGGYRPTGVSWYRKRFTVPAAAAQRRVFVEFDGVMAQSEVWINGHRLGRRPSGAVSFGYELTGFLEAGEDQSNVLAVRTDTSVQPASRWYSGEGIYRHVRLVTTGAVRIEPWGVFVTTPQVSAASASVRVSTSVGNGDDRARDLAVRVSLVDPDGRAIATAASSARPVAIGETAPFSQEIAVANPQRWALGAGRIYRAVVQVVAGDAVLDDDIAAFGIRDARFEPATGFWLNGQHVRIQGVALHQNGGAVGAAVPLGVWEYRLARLRRLGVNAIRTAHNPPAPEFLDLCDRMGFLVMDELFDAWTVGKPDAEQGYNRDFLEWSQRDARDAIRRDRNHPSIILYSTGNEIHDTPNAVLAKRILAGLIGTIKAEDDTHPITQALFRPNVSHDYTDGLADMLDVIGTNYRDRELVDAQRAKPTRKIIGTEQDHLRGTWLIGRDNPSYSGQFLWAGIDYLGEGGGWPYLSSGAGLLDRTGEIKPRGYERQSWWTAAPMVRIARLEPALANTDPRRRPDYDRMSNWTPQDAASALDQAVDVYSNCDEVELVLNGRSLGSKPRPADASARSWKVAFEPGTIRAIGKNGGVVVATHELRTAGAPAKLRVETDRAGLPDNWDGVAFVRVTAVDANGVPCPWARDDVTFSVAGPGVVAAVDNGDPTDPAPFPAADRRLWHGACIAIVKASAASGAIQVTAAAAGLASGSVNLTAESSP